MMEKPLAVSNAHGRRIARPRPARADIQVLVNYETTWYASNRVVYDGEGGHSRARAQDGRARRASRARRRSASSRSSSRWLTDPVLNGGGALTDFGCYGANLFTWLMDGARPGLRERGGADLQARRLSARRRRGARSSWPGRRQWGSSRRRGTGPSTARTSRSTGAPGQALTVKRGGRALPSRGQGGERGPFARPGRARKTTPCAISPAVVRRRRPSCGPLLAREQPRRDRDPGRGAGIVADTDARCSSHAPVAAAGLQTAAGTSSVPPPTTFETCGPGDLRPAARERGDPWAGARPWLVLAVALRSRLGERRQSLRRRGARRLRAAAERPRWRSGDGEALS